MTKESRSPARKPFFGDKSGAAVKPLFGGGGATTRKPLFGAKKALTVFTAPSPSLLERDEADGGKKKPA